MIIQTVLLGIVVPIFLGSVFHVWRGGAGWRLGLYIFLAELGFWIGHFTAQSLGWNFLTTGQLQLGVGIIVSILFLSLGHWLSSKEPETETKRKKENKRGGRI